MISRFSQSHSFNARVTLFTLSVLFVSLWTLSLFASHMLQADMQRMLGAQQFQIVSRIAMEVNEDLKDRVVALERIAKDMDGPLAKSPAALQTLLEQRPLLQALFNGGVFVTDAQGTAIADVPLANGRIGTNYMDRASVAGPLQTGKTVIGRPAMGKKLGAPIFSIVAPIHDRAGAVIGTLVGTINLGTPNFLDKISQGKYGASGGFLLIDPASRMIITASDKRRVMETLPAAGQIAGMDRMLAGFEGTDIFVNARGSEVMNSGKVIAQAGWRAVASIPTAELFEPVRAMRLHMLSATVLLTLLTGVLTWWMLKRQLSPMLHVSEYRYRAIIDGSPVPMVLSNGQGNIELINKAFSEYTGYTLSDLPRLSDWWAKAQPDPQYRQQVAAHWQSNLEQSKRSGEMFMPIEMDVRCKDESVRTFVAGAAYLEKASTGNHLLTLYDITDSKKSAAKIKELNRDFVAFLENTSDFIYFKDENSRFRFCSQPLARITGHAHWRDMVGKHDLEVFPSETAKIYVEEERPIFREGKPLLNKIDPYVDESGTHRWVETNKWPLLDERGHVVGLFGISHDVTERHQMEADRDVLQEQVRQMAYIDPLTQLPNRRLLDDRLGQALAASMRSRLHGALMFLDLDNFKPLNDQYGHEVGDLLLIEVGRRLVDCVRASDSVARLGGDEFVVLLSELDTDKAQSIDQAMGVAEKIRAALAAPYLLRVAMLETPAVMVEHHCSASIGAVVFLDHIAGPSELMKAADIAMYHAKEAGRNRVHFSGLDF